MFAIVGAVRSVRREFESGTAAVALSHPVARVQFLVAKACGAYAAFLLFAFVLGSVTAVMVNGSLIGAAVAKKTGDIPRIWGVSYACGVASFVLPYVVGALFNRFFRSRFALSAFMTAICIALASLFYRPSASLLRLVPAVGRSSQWQRHRRRHCSRRTPRAPCARCSPPPSFLSRATTAFPTRSLETGSSPGLMLRWRR